METEAQPPLGTSRVVRTGRSARIVEFLLVGGMTPVLFLAGWLARRTFGLDEAELAAGFLTFYAAYVVNDPHFAVTYLLFYKDARARAFGASVPRAQRVRWIVAGLVVPVVLVGWAAFAVATHAAQSLGWMVQAMFALVGWHYVKQGFGVLTVLSARRGARITPRERIVFLAHCFCGWAFAWANPAVAAGEYEEKGVVYWAPARPRWFELGAGAVLAVSTIALAFVLVTKWRRERARFPLVPVAGLLVTVWSWTIFANADPVFRYLVPALHAVQYFYFVWLMKRNEARAHEGAPHFGRPVAVRIGVLAVSALALGWLLFRGAPTLLDDLLFAVPRSERARRAFDPLGETPFFAAFFVVVNIHHYFMDHVIWRRENPDTRWLRDDATPTRRGAEAEDLDDASMRGEPGTAPTEPMAA